MTQNKYKKAIKFGKAIISDFPQLPKRKFRALLGYHLVVDDSRKLNLIIDFLDAFEIIKIDDQNIVTKAGGKK